MTKAIEATSLIFLGLLCGFIIGANMRLGPGELERKAAIFYGRDLQ